MLPPQTIAALLSAAMQEGGYTQTTLATKAGVSQALINALLHADPVPVAARQNLRRLESLRKLARACNKPALYFEYPGGTLPVVPLPGVRGHGLQGFRREVRTRRLALGLTQAELAERVDVNQRTISRLELQKLVPSPELRERLIQVLEIGNPYPKIEVTLPEDKTEGETPSHETH